MSRTVWCVFQKLPGESCPALSAVCASREAAAQVARMSEEDERRMGQEVSAWTVGEWGVLEGDVDELEEIQQISDVLDPMRAGAIPMAEAAEAAAETISDQE